jgi:hypothetical protein
MIWPQSAFSNNLALFLFLFVLLYFISVYVLYSFLLPKDSMVAHACNTSYSGGRDREDHCPRPAQAKSWQAPFSTKKMNVVVLGYNPSYLGA